MPTPPASQEGFTDHQGQLVFRQLLEERHSERLPLPHLDAPSESLHFFKDLIEKAFRSFASLFSGSSNLAIGDAFIGFLQIAFGALLLVLVFFIIRALVGLMAKSSLLNAQSSGVPSGWTADSADMELESALKLGDWPRAMRLRWKLFLSRSRLAESVTPREYFSGSPVRDSFEPSVTAQYGLMFGGVHTPAGHGEALYRAYDRELVPLERPAPEAISQEETSA